MNEDPDGKDPQQVQWTQQVTSRIRIKPVDNVSFTEHNVCLQRDRQVKDIQTVGGHGCGLPVSFHFTPDAFFRLALPAVILIILLHTQFGRLVVK